MIDRIIEPTAERIEKCHCEVLRLNSLVDDLNQLSLLERSDLELQREEGDLNELLKTVVTNYKIQAEQKGLDIKLKSTNARIFADMTRLSQVFINVISNAIKYTDKGEITITLSEDKEAYLVEVKDTGIGISEQDIPKIFSRLYRADQSRSRGTGGSGIGLSIAKKIVEAHGGMISVQSKINQGSNFKINIPKDSSLKNTKSDKK